MSELGNVICSRFNNAGVQLGWGNSRYNYAHNQLVVLSPHIVSILDRVFAEYVVETTRLAFQHDQEMPRHDDLREGFIRSITQPILFWAPCRIVPERLEFILWSAAQALRELWK